MSLIVNGNKIRPAPFVTLNKNLSITSDGRPLSSTFTITLNGTLLPNKGSPFSDGTFYTGSGNPPDEAFTTDDTRFNSILRKQDAIRELFNQPGLLLEYAPNDGSPAVLANIKLQNISFEEGNWVTRCRYTITLEAEDVNRQDTQGEDDFGEFNTYYLSQANESIQVNESDTGDGSYTISHTITAVGKSVYDNPASLLNNQEPWENARDWCLTKVNSQLVTYLIDTNTKNKYNKKLVENIDKWAGSYSIVITYTITDSNNNYIHNYEINTQTIRSQADDFNGDQGLTQNITINGTIQGLSTGDLSQNDRMDAARAAFTTIEPTIPSLVGLSVDHLYASKTIAENRGNGVLTYSITYNNFPYNSYEHTYSVSLVYSGGSTTQASINGNIKYNTSNGDINGMFANAQSLWNTIKIGIDNTIESVADISLISEPSSVTLNYNKSQLTVEYTASYNATDEINLGGANYLDTFEVSLNDANITDDGVTRKSATVSINGSILGYSFDGNAATRFNNALSRWNAIKNNLRNRMAVAVESETDISNRIISKTVGFNKIIGTVSYNYTYSLRNDIFNDSIISEDISIETANRRQLAAVHLIPGSLAGPIIQNLNSYTEARLTITANWILDEGASTNVADSRFTELENLYAPSTSYKFIDNDTTNYNPVTGNYTKSRTWVYRQ